MRNKLEKATEINEVMEKVEELSEREKGKLLGRIIACLEDSEDEGISKMAEEHSMLMFASLVKRAREVSQRNKLEV